MMTLRQWLDANNELQKDFASRSGISEPTLSRIIRGKVKADLDDAIRICKATKGAVTFEALSKMARRRAA